MSTETKPQNPEPNEVAKKYALPVPGVVFLHKGATVDLRTITEEQAARLANDPSCKFIQPKNASAAPPAPKA
ncbi:MAG: hypothetical protein JNL05_12900 [Flavobacteriales bacterium]|nr:hypothetical protein [Flavobacteriales bacterium]